jgi:hypothetical protein
VKRKAATRLGRRICHVITELNGRDVFSATAGRAVGFEDVSADLLAGIDVYKNHLG